MKPEEKPINIGEAVKINGRVMIYLEPGKYLTLNQIGRLDVIDLDAAEDEIERLKYEHLTLFLRNRLLFLNEKYGDPQKVD